MRTNRLRALRHLSGRTARRVLVLGSAMVLLGSGASHTAAWAAPTAPEDDPFYSTPRDIADRSNGTVLRNREIRMFGLPLRVSAWQLNYRTTGSDDRPVASIATVLVSATPWSGPGPRPLLSYQVAEDSLGARCAPSVALHRGPDSAVSSTVIEMPFIVDALRQGWAVIIPDYQGPGSRFLDGEHAARAVLDGMRAARSFAPAGLSTDSKIGAWGYSGGAFATLWAAEQRGRYAPELPIVGVTAGGVPIDIATIARDADGGARAGLTMLIVLALMRNATGPELAALMNERGRAVMVAESASCGTDLLARYLDAKIDDYAKTPGLLTHQAFLAAAQRQELGNQTPDIPLYLYHSTTDEVVPVAGFEALLRRYCSSKSTVVERHSSADGHNGAAMSEAAGALAFLTDRFEGTPLTPGCDRA
ncbi:lipase family protein [Nocardia sp. NPDC005978]|uniref:lipase family protein n=1 Tax=Nocardia sp. NPDC005978 TaxID=3156725 RepID=UPI0033AB586B